MKIIIALLGVALIAVVLGDTFETIILPRRVTRKLRLARLFYRSTWKPWALICGLRKNVKKRESLLGYYGPLSLLMLLAVWAWALILGFAMLHWSAGSALAAAYGDGGFATDLYMSGTNFFTLGLGDVVPRTGVERALTVVEAGLGFGFLAMVIGYLPVLYQSFSRREVNISLLDARAGSPPTATELLRRHAHDHGMEALRQLLHEWERWSSELLESHISYPVLCYFRSQHDNQSWLGALTTVLDASALAIVGIEGACAEQAQLTFAMARHAMVDLAQIFSASPKEAVDRLPAAELQRLRAVLRAAGLPLREGAAADMKLAELRHMYEPFVNSLSTYLCVSTPPWIVKQERADNWQTSPWGRIANLGTERAVEVGDPEHF